MFLFSASVCLADSSIERNFRIGTIVPGGTAGSVIHLQGSPPKVTQDNDNFFYNDTDNELYFGGKTLVTADIVLKATGGALFNQNKANVDFGVSTVNNSNFLFVDASEDSVIIGNTSESSTATLAIHIVDVNNQRGISVVGASGQSQNLLEFANISGNILAQINANGGAVFNENGLDTDFRVEGDATTHLIFADASAEGVMFGTSTDLSSRVGIVPNAATDIGLVIKAAASQTASLTEWQNSSAALLLSIGELGQIRVAGSWDPVIGAPTAGLVFVDNGGTYNDTLIAKDTSGNIGYVVTNPGSHQFFTAGSSTPMFEITPSGVSLASITLTGQGAYTAPTGVIFNNSGGTANDSGIWRDTDQFVINYKSSQGLFSEAEHRFYLGDGLAVTFDQEAAKTFVLFDLGAGDGSAKKGVVIKGKASQSASLLQLQNSDASVFVDSGDGLASSEFVINEQGLDIDFRIEGDTDANLLFVDASTDRVGIGTNTPGALLDVRGAAIFNEAGADADFRIEGDTNANLFFLDASADTIALGDITVTSGGNISEYRNVSTTNWGVPAIYGTAARVTGQTAQSVAVATYTVGAADGSFEVSGNVNVTASVTHSFSLDVTYTDETNTVRTLILPMTQLGGSFISGGLITNVTGASPYESPVLHIRCKTATTITIRPSAGTYTSVTYNAEGIIKQIS